LSKRPDQLQVIGAGDFLVVSIWEATPATLFGNVQINPTGLPTPSVATTLPEQPVDGEGCITVPFAGRVPAAGKTLPDIAAEIKQRLAKKANQPEVLVLQTRNLSSTVTVVGEVTTSIRVPLTAAHERLLDALAFAAGVKQPVNKTTIQITRGEGVYALPLETIIQDPKQNVSLQPGDVITALFQPLSFTALGASGKNDEINFETQGITLAQALARSGGLIDSRSNPSGVFVFRLEKRSAEAASAQGADAAAATRIPRMAEPPLCLDVSPVLQIFHEPCLVDSHDWPEAHRHGRELPEAWHQPRVWIRRNTLPIDLLAEVIHLLVGEPAKHECSRIHAGRGMALDEYQVTTVLVRGSVPEVVVANIVERRGRRERGNVPANVGIFIGAQHHGE